MGRRRTTPVVTVGMLWDALTADYGIAGSYGLTIEDILVDTGTSLPTTLTAMIATINTILTDTGTTLEARQVAILADVTAIAGAAMRGTDSAALAASWTAALATILGNFSAARIGYLDNIDASLRELFYEHFATMLDDDPDLVVAGDVTDGEKLVDNLIAMGPIWDTVDEYAELTFEASAYIKQVRLYGNVGLTGDGRFKLQAYIDGTWTDVLTSVPTHTVSEWDSWVNLTTPSSAMKWRWVLTATDTGLASWTCIEIELKGVKIG